MEPIAVVGIAGRFPGASSHMTRELYDQEPSFRADVDTCCDIAAPYLGHNLRDLMFPMSGQEADVQLRLQDMVNAQVALFIISYALAQLWQKWGVRPAAMIGYSVGEYVAACLAGVFSLEGAVTSIALRGRLMQQMPRGSMLSVALSEQAVVPYLTNELAIGAISSPDTCVVAGRPIESRYSNGPAPRKGSPAGPSTCPTPSTPR